MIMDETWVNDSHRNPGNKLLNEKKQTILHDCDAGDGIHVEHTSAGTVVFDQGMAVLPNDSRANDIYGELMARKRDSNGKAVHPHRYAYTPNREGMKRDNIHKMRVTTIGLPWNKYDEFGRKIEDEE